MLLYCLVAGFWLLVACFWLLGAGYLLLGSYSLVPDAVYWFQVSGYRLISDELLTLRHSVSPIIRYLSLVIPIKARPDAISRRSYLRYLCQCTLSYPITIAPARIFVLFGCWVLVACCWLLVACCWLLVAGCPPTSRKSVGTSVGRLPARRLVPAK